MNNQLIKLIIFVIPMFFCSGWTQTGDEPGGYMVDYLHERNLKTDIKSLIEIVQSSNDLEVRWRAVTILGMKKVTESKEVLKKLLNSGEDPFLIQRAAVALKMMDDASGHSVLRELFKSEKSNIVKSGIARDLAGFFGDPLGKEFVLQMATSESFSERMDSALPLVAILIILENKEELKQMLDTFISLGKDPHGSVRREFVIVAPDQEQFLDAIIPVVEDIAKNNDESQGVRRYAQIRLSAWETIKNNRPPKKNDQRLQAENSL